MYKFFVSLISALSLSAYADPPTFTVGGFIYGTYFSDKAWYDDRAVGSVNVDVFDYDTNFATRWQITTYRDQIIRRGVLEYSHPIQDTVEMVYQIGRFARPDSFANGITDNPSVYGMAMLPNAGYSYRMFNGSFAIMDGSQMQTTYKAGEYLYRGRLAYGEMVVPNERDLVMEAFKRELPGVGLAGRTGSYDLGLHFESQKWHAFASRNHYVIATRIIGTPTALSRFVTSSYRDIEYTLDKVGVRYSPKGWWVQGEYFKDVTYKTDAREVEALINKSVGVYAVAGYYWTPKLSTYLGYSHGKNKLNSATNMDRFVGTTYDEADWTASLEFHRGYGFAWRKYDAPFIRLPEVPTWNSWVASLTYRF